MLCMDKKSVYNMEYGTLGNTNVLTDMTLEKKAETLLGPVRDHQILYVELLQSMHISDRIPEVHSG